MPRRRARELLTLLVVTAIAGAGCAQDRLADQLHGNVVGGRPSLARRIGLGTSTLARDRMGGDGPRTILPRGTVDDEDQPELKSILPRGDAGKDGVPDPNWRTDRSRHSIEPDIPEMSPSPRPTSEDEEDTSTDRRASAARRDEGLQKTGEFRDSALAAIDKLEDKLGEEGTIGVKAPDIWGQDRMTKFRSEYEAQLSGEQATGFKSVVGAMLRRYEAETTHLEISGGAKAPAGSSEAGAPPSDAGDAAGKNKEGVGLEATGVLDERSHFLNHLSQLRRINAGDELTDLPGYGLYSIRMPVTLTPGPSSRKGKGAVVTVEARPALTDDLLASTVRKVVLAATRDQLASALSSRVGGQAGDATRGREDVVPSVATSELDSLYGAANLDAIAGEIRSQLGGVLGREPYRADALVSTWLDRELAAAYPMAAREARTSQLANRAGRRDPILDLGRIVAARQYPRLAGLRGDHARPDVVRASGDRYEEGRTPDPARSGPALMFALKVQAALVDRQLKEDIKAVARGASPGPEDGPEAAGHSFSLINVIADVAGESGRFARPGDPLDAVDEMAFYGPSPGVEERRVFNKYVATKWRIRLFAIDPVIEQQQVSDAYGSRSTSHLGAAAAAPASLAGLAASLGRDRRSDLDAELVKLNPTMVGFGVGESTFGWRFYPRVQTPTTPASMVGRVIRARDRIARDVAGRDDASSGWRIEPGQRECTALVVMPTFVSAIEFTVVGGWFDIDGPRAGRSPAISAALALKRQAAYARTDLMRSMQEAADARPDLMRSKREVGPGLDDLEILEDRLAQLEDQLPVQHFVSRLPFGGDAIGPEIFDPGGGRLAPALVAWHGQPPVEGAGSTIVVRGRGFSVHDTSVLVGGEPSVVVPISRTSLRVTIARTARAMTGPDTTKPYFDLVVATPNGLSNHLLVDARPADVTRPPGVEKPAAVDPPEHPDPEKDGAVDPGPSARPARRAKGWSRAGAATP